jgi:hypothetical protein
MPFRSDGPLATFEDAQWTADAMAFDHDAPVSVQPAMYGSVWDGDSRPRDANVVSPIQPVDGTLQLTPDRYWGELSAVYDSVVELRFHGCYGMRYIEEPWDWYPESEVTYHPTTEFRDRFGGREQLVTLYAMATRQADALSEYLCLYRVLESADGSNGKHFAQEHIGEILRRDFGELRVFGIDSESWTNAFRLYQHRARLEVGRLQADEVDIPSYLYSLRNSLAHGKHNTLTSGNLGEVERVGRALPMVKLLARLAVEGEVLPLL